MMITLFYLLMSVAPAQERTLEDLSPEQVEWIQTVVDNIGRNLVYTEGIYILPVLHTADFALAHQFARDHDDDLRTLDPEGVKIGAVDPDRPRVWFRPGVAPLRIYDGDRPVYEAWQKPENMRTLQLLVQVQERIDAATGEEQTRLERLRETIVRKCAEGLEENAGRM